MVKLDVCGCVAGDMVEDAVKGALGIKDKEEDKKKGGIKSIFKGSNKEEEEKKKKKKKDEDKGFFSKVFHKDDDEDKGLKKSGFQGLFAEGQEGGAMGGGGAMEEGGAMGGGEEAWGNPGQTVAVSDRGMYEEQVTQIHDSLPVRLPTRQSVLVLRIQTHTDVLHVFRCPTL